MRASFSLVLLSSGLLAQSWVPQQSGTTASLRGVSAVNPNVVLPFLSSALSFIFAILVADQWLRRRQAYQLVWTIGLLWYGISAGTEFLGGLLGWVAGYGGLLLINAAGITMPPPPSFSRGISLHINFVPELFAGVLLLVTFVLVLSAVIPAVRASRLRIVDDEAISPQPG